jgi:hypothetical protein
MIKYIVSFISIILSFTNLFSQDLNCRIKINDIQVQIADKSIFRSLEQRLTEFMNNTKWSGENVQLVERVDMNIEIILTSYDQATYEYKASAIIQSRRTIYGSTYTSTLLSFNDENFDFKFQDQDRLDFQDGNHLSDLSSLMGFYAYYTLGLDFDSFGEEGGTALFNKAFQVANVAQQSSTRAGWKPFERTVRTRYNLVDNILNERFRPLRKAYYIYHRKGLDQFAKDPIVARKQIFASLNEVKKVFKIAPNTVMLLVFFEAKSDELINIYKGAEEIEKPKAIELLSEINISNLNKYEKIRGS